MSAQIDESELKNLDKALQIYETKIDRNPKNYKIGINDCIKQISKAILTRRDQHNYVVIDCNYQSDEDASYNRNTSITIFCEVLRSVLNQKFSKYVWSCNEVHNDRINSGNCTNHYNQLQVSWHLYEPPPYNK